jgi:hypothetical protein
MHASGGTPLRCIPIPGVMAGRRYSSGNIATAERKRRWDAARWGYPFLMLTGKRRRQIPILSHFQKSPNSSILPAIYTRIKVTVEHMTG